MAQDVSPHKPAAPKKGPWRAIALLATVAGVMVLAYFLGIGEKIKSLQDWIAALGAWGPVIFVLIYAGATLAALPGVALTAVAGALFGSVLGVITVSLGSTLGAGLAFLAARYVARTSVEEWLGRSPKFQRLDRLTAEQGAIMVAITRLVPLFPFNLLNFGFGLTKVSFGTYLFYSWLCMLPGTVLYVVGFDALFTALESGEMPWVLVGVVALMALILALLVRRARQRLGQDVGPENPA